MLSIGYLQNLAANCAELGERLPAALHQEGPGAQPRGHCPQHESE